MPAKSKKPRRAMAIAKHHPEKLYKRNRGMLSMRKAELHEYATSKEKGLPARAKKRRKHFKKGSTTVDSYE